MNLIEFLHQQLSEEQFGAHQLLHFYDKLDLNKQEYVNKDILRQKIRNLIYKQEINILSHAASELNIQIAFMKGLVLSEDLYNVPETRFFGDIDILINSCDLKKFLKKCKTLGYNFLFMESDEAINKGIQQSISARMHHYYSLTKTVNKSGIPVSIMIEVHTHIYSQTFHQIDTPYIELTKSALNSSVLFENVGFEKIHVMNKRDDLLALMVHAVKHFFEDILESMKSNKDSAFFNMRQLLDIDLFIEKYDIDYVALIEQAIKWDAVSELIFMLKIIKAYKPDNFETINLDKIYQKHRRPMGFVAEIIDMFINNNSDNIFSLLLLPSWDLAKYIFKNRPYIEYPVIVCPKSDNYCDSQKSSFIIDESADIINNRFKTHYKDGRQIIHPDYWRCESSARWTEEYLFIKLKVESSYKLNLKGSSHKGWAPADSIDFYFLRNTMEEKQRFIRQLEIPLQINDDADSPFLGKPFIKIFDAEFNYLNGRQVKYKIWDENSFIYDFEVCGNNYILEIGFKWDMLRDCISNNEIVFDAGIVAFDDDPPRRNILSLADTMCYSDFHDITSFGCLRLTDNHSSVELSPQIL